MGIHWFSYSNSNLYADICTWEPILNGTSNNVALVNAKKPPAAIIIICCLNKYYNLMGGKNKMH